MAAKNKCTYCNSRKGKRRCAALDGMICTLCCGEHRLVEIDCTPDCAHLGHEHYQEHRRDDRAIADAMHAVKPPVLGYDVFEASPEAGKFAFSLEHTFGTNYLRSRIKDADVMQALRAVYLSVYKSKQIAITHDFSQFLVESVRDVIRPSFEKKVPIDLQEKIILRLMVSISNISGGIMGDCGYLDYVKNNILESSSEEHGAFENGFGKGLIKKFLS